MSEILSIVDPAGEIAVMCDCPYTGKARELKETPEIDEKRKEMLRKGIWKTNQELDLARKVMIDTRFKLATLQKFLGMELGWTVNPLILTDATWKNRVREVSYLKSEQMNLVDYLRNVDPRYRKDPNFYPTKLSTSTEDLLFATQEQILKQLYHGYTVFRTEHERQVGVCVSEFLQLKEKYENKLHHNKVMEREIADVKKKICELQRKYLEDKCLIDYITEHHFTMKGCFVDLFPKKSPSEGGDQKDAFLDSEALKYKELYEESKKDKRKMLMAVRNLAEDLEFFNQRIITAEDVCSRNIIVFRNTARKLKDAIVLSKWRPTKREVWHKYSYSLIRSRQNQYEAETGENEYLKNFLRKSILAKVQDMKYYRESLISTAEKYRLMLEEVRNAILAEAKRKKEEEEKKKKPKGKEKGKGKDKGKGKKKK